ncbi:ABC transporter ATP-binding protein [Desulfococcaceae bacterium HSG8]|nr:ABC transporter ATP-binding protein [Desulfococcaceae bacterium HSG8]
MKYVKSINMNSILEVRNLVKRYPDVTAVDGLDLSVQTGTCMGLLGPNGAGKTTTIEIIEGVIPPTSGQVLYKGKVRTSDFQEEVGIQFQATSLLSFLSVRETLETFRNLYRNPMQLDKIISLCQLEDILERGNDKISGGQKQRLMLAMALVNDPDLIFLDEPTTGLDPQIRRHVWDIVQKIKESGKTVVLTTHYMEEARILCDEIAIIDKGKIIIQGSPDDLLKEYRSGVTVSFPKDTFPEPPETCFPDGICTARKFSETRKHYEIHTDDVNNCLNELLKHGIDLTHITIQSQNLEDLFLELTGHGLRQ